MKPVVADKDDLGCRHKSKVKAYFRNFGVPRFQREEKNDDLICQSITTSFKLSAETKMEDTKPLEN